MDNERSIVILFAYIRHETTTHKSQENEDTTTTRVYCTYTLSPNTCTSHDIKVW